MNGHPAAPGAGAGLPASIAEQVHAAQGYLEAHQIAPVMHRLMALLVYHRPATNHLSDILPTPAHICKRPGTDKASFDRALSAEVARENAQERSGDFVESSIARHFDISDDFKGYSGQFSPSLVDKLKKSSKVAAVEPVVPVYASGSQSGATWGLVRISERALDLTKPYVYPSSAGSGVDVYIVDTGIYTAHPDFGGRAKWGTTTCDDCVDEDDNGHGTHVAGTVASKTYGVAKSANVIAVKVLGGDGSGTNEGVIAGINYVAEQAKAKGKTVAANMSLGGSYSAALNSAVKAATSSGVVFAVAAGNENQDACNTSPASEPSAITVGSTTKTETRSSFSNYGKCLDIFAPGSSITSTWNNGGTNTISGTSMASPHVAGVAALLIGQDPSASASTIVSRLISNSTPSVVKSGGSGSPNKLAYVAQ
ncbi:hypothetical protein AMAG_15512 [Allomyces macrogynus ATCC 38327]|uniref:Peptidase S8/S53 domain-containing protein n=1 Tax=Allomyces macrogynus (strain ATCC 38327) TaxID=578462 RepID=A0A0L0T9M9_ALLM3|nr:hypothetical protein AMAG_15512 [Allomyces macrogynus ATCC 38327]|eukprot:KNE71269.1 hypothetical protein AMAG_15512 [Allomyces macrogynus ATCC 38327]